MESMNFYWNQASNCWTRNNGFVNYTYDSIAECFEAMDKLRNPGCVGYFHKNNRTYEMK